MVEPGIYIVNYDILQRFESFYTGAWGAVILDEAHYQKSPKTLRAKCVKRLKATYRLALTGTPFPNKPIEIQTTLAWLRPDLFGNRMRFALRYCDARQGRFGWEVDGHSNESELNNLLRAECMVRRLKKDVLTELPPKIRQVIELPCDGLEDVLEEEWAAFHSQENILNTMQVALQLAKASESDGEYHAAVENLKAGLSAAFAEMSLMRLKVARAKVPFVLKHLEDVCTPDHPVITFAHHREVVKEIADGANGMRAVTITGDTPLTVRHQNVQMFQAGQSHLFVGNMQAAGVGITLTRSSHVVFAELDWVPANLSQAEDRAHRIGQRDSVLVQHLVLEGSLDAVMAKRVIEKQKVIDAILNTRMEGGADMVAEPEVDASPDTSRPATASTSREKIKQMADVMRREDAPVVHAALRMIAGLDMDFARIRNNVGFNRLDADIGHDLASKASLSPRQAALALKIVWKYRAQLGDDMENKLKEIKERT